MTTGLDVNTNSICEVCPHCGIKNTDMSLICQYCGAFLQNICTGITPTKYKNLVFETPNTYLIKYDWIVQFGSLNSYHNIIPGNLLIDNVVNNIDSLDDYSHDQKYILNGYSRFCDQCGCLSSFYLQGLLPDVNLQRGANPFCDNNPFNQSSYTN